MSTPKEKYLATAQKFIARGQLDRAIKDYEQVVALDPSDMRNRQRLAELLIKVNRKDGAVAEYKTIGKYYADNTYYLKAIAVYKQIQKLTPDDIDITLTLATLNEKQGLTGNALTEYGIVLNHYQRAGRLDKALKVLEGMINLEPENLNTQFQFAELHFSAGQPDKSYQEFTQLALLLWKQENLEAFNQVCIRIQTLFPEQKEFRLDFIAALLDKGETMGVIPLLQQLIRTDVANLRAWLLLVDVFRKQGETEKLKGVLQQILKAFPDQVSLRTDLVRLHLDDRNAPAALELLAGSEQSSVAAGDFDRVEALYTEIEKLSPKDERVYAGLRALYEAAGDKGKLAALTARIASENALQASPAPPRETVETPPAGKKVDVGEKPQVTPAPTKAAAPDWEEEIELPFPEDMTETAGEYGDSAWEPEMPSPVPEVELPQSADLGEFADEVSILDDYVEDVEELEPELEAEEEPEETLEEILEAESEEIVSALPEDFSTPLVDESLELEVELPDAEMELEESFDELDLGAEPLEEPEIAAGDLLDLDYVERGEHVTSDDELEELQLESVVEGSAVLPQELELTVPESLAGGFALSGEEDTVPLVLHIDSENDWLAREGFGEATVEEEVEEVSPGVAGIELEAIAELDLSEVLGETSPEVTEELPGFWGEDVELATLGDELFADGGSADAGAGTDSAGKYSMDSLFSAFKKGLDQQVESGDTETHFNLGIAYKEMGLYDDAIGEFEQALHDPQRKVDSITLQAMCYRDKGDTAKAEELLRGGVALNGLRKDEHQSLAYELALLLEATDRPGEALSYYLEVRAMSPGFRDTSDRIAALGGGEDSDLKRFNILDLEED